MARLARTVVAGLPHHVTQRGNRREPIFFEGGDQEGRNASKRYLFPRFCFVLSCAMTRSAIGIMSTHFHLPGDHRSDESSTGYSFMSCSPAELMSASPVIPSFSPNFAAVKAPAAKPNCPYFLLSQPRGPLHPVPRFPVPRFPQGNALVDHWLCGKLRGLEPVWLLACRS